VIKPPVGLGTAEVYEAYAKQTQESHSETARAGGLAQFVANVLSGTRLKFARHMRNALTRAASSLSLWVDRLKDVCNELDFVGHQLSGSGSAYFGVCRHAAHARRLADILRTRQLGLVYATRSCH
jgi:4-diphosphocytidyl-2-C-methyl-D-erythritol kinase